MKARLRLLDLLKSFNYAFGYAKAPVLLLVMGGTWGRQSLFIGRAPRLEIRGRLVVGRNFRVRSSVARSSLSTSAAGLLVIGDDVFINQGSVIHAEQLIEIGDRVDIGDNVRIYDTNFHATRPGELTKVRAVVIESDVWIGSGATILPGVRVGRGAVVGTGAVVTHDVPAGGICVGPRARVVDTFDVPNDFDRRKEDGYTPKHDD